MAVRRRDSFRSISALAAAAALPLCLASCAASSSGVELPLGDSLLSATDGEVFETPDERAYRVTSIEITEPALGSDELQTLADQASDGSMVLSDGVITDAHLTLAMEGLPELEFALTEPVVLRRDGNGDVVNAKGTLTVGNTVRYTTHAAITPRFDDEAESIEFDVRLDLPGTPLTPSSGSDEETTEGPNHIEANVSLIAE